MSVKDMMRALIPLGVKRTVPPDFSKEIVVNDTPYTAPEDGWFTCHSKNVNTTISINGKTVAQGNWEDGRWSGNLNCQIAVAAGDRIDAAGDRIDAVGGIMRFYPFKEVS